MGDMLSLIEQAEREFDGDVAQEGAARLLEGRFTLEDFLSQLQQVKKLGSLGGILSLLPGMPKELKQAKDSIDDRQVAQVEAIIQSMTRKERADSSLIDGGRRKRIATGSGTTTQEVNQLLRQFKEAQQLMRSPGMLGGMLGGRGGRGAAQALSEQMGDLAALAPGGADAFGELGPGLPGGSSPMRGLGAGGSKGSKGGKKKKGGRVTPKASGGSR
jgi:signal recognition particle subunit SRP54